MVWRRKDAQDAVSLFDQRFHRLATGSHGSHDLHIALGKGVLVQFDESPCLNRDRSGDVFLAQSSTAAALKTLSVPGST